MGIPDSQKQTASEIFELYQSLREYIDEFESISSSNDPRSTLKKKISQN